MADFFFTNGQLKYLFNHFFYRNLVLDYEFPPMEFQQNYDEQEK